MPEEDPVLHVYPLEMEHGDVTIVGNREGLRMLRDAIKDALQEGPGQTTYAAPYAEDGEMCDLGVTLQPGNCHDDVWARWRKKYFVAREEADEPTAAEEREGIAEFLGERANRRLAHSEYEPDAITRTALASSASWVFELTHEIRNGAHTRVSEEES